MHILIVDDDPMFRRALGAALESTGFVIREAHSANAASRMLLTDAPDVVISDLYMPDGDGLELLRDVQQICPETQVILISGGGRRGHFGLFAAARELGAAAVLSKPFAIDSLLTTIAHVHASSACGPGGWNGLQHN